MDLHMPGELTSSRHGMVRYGMRGSPCTSCTSWLPYPQVAGVGLACDIAKAVLRQIAF